MQHRAKALPGNRGTWVTLSTTAALLTLALSFQAVATESYPVSPADPTLQDCANLISEFHQIREQVYSEWLQCTSKPAHFGWDVGCRGRPEINPWIECAPLDHQMCEIDDLSSQEVGECQMRANLKLSRTEKSDSESEIDLAQRIKRANDLYERFKKLYELISDPQKFFESSLSDFGASYHQVYPESRPPNLDLAQQLYRYAQNQARAGTHSHPVIGGIQQEALNAIATFHERTLDNLEYVVTTMSSFSTDLRRPLQSPYGRGSVDCSIFRDVDASRALLTNNRSVWHELNEGCGVR